MPSSELHVAQAEASAPANIALIKYWGKRRPAGDAGAVLNLPAVGSLSITLDALVTRTRIRFDAALERDALRLNGRDDSNAVARVSRHLDVLRELAGRRERAFIDSENNFPTGAGLASSASGFAALTVAGVIVLALAG